MKRIILSVIVMAFAVAAQAGDAKDQDQPSCCGSKTKTSMQTKVKTSTQSKEGTAASEKGCSGCCKQQAAVKQTALLSPKAAGAQR
jgi:hypothetical protein